MSMETTRAETPSDDGESDDTDNVSLADTVYSDDDEDQVWDLEKIIAETECDELAEDGTVRTVTYYLLKWKGYSIYRSTWETAEKLVDGVPETWRAWQETKMRVTRGKTLPFDVEAWEDKRQERYDKRVRRHVRRNRKREHLALPVVKYDVDSEEGIDAAQTPTNEDDREMMDVGEEASEDESPVRRTRKLPNDQSSDEDTAPRSPTRKKRRTAEQMEREREHTRALLKRKKGIAVPVDKNNSSANPSVKPSMIAKSVNKAPGGLVKPATAPPGPKPTTSQSGPTKVVPQSTFFQSFTRPKLPKIEVPKTINTASSSTSVTPHSAQAASTTPISAHPQSAPIARMVGGPSKISKKPVPITGRSAAGTTNIFANIHKPVQRRNRQSNPGFYKNMSHRYNAQKLAQRELIPDLKDLVLIDPATRTLSGANANANSINVETSRSRQPSWTSRTLGHTPTDSSIDEEEAFRQTQASQALMHATPPIDSQSKGKDLPISQIREQTGDYSKPCYWFSKINYCKWGEECPFPHNLDDDRPSMSVGQMKAQMTCHFWLHSRCLKSEEECEYAHSKKLFVSPLTNAEPPSKFPEETAKVIQPAFTEDTVLEPTNSSASRPIARDRMTCPYWLLKYCHKPAASCMYAHYLCHYVVGLQSGPRTLTADVPMSKRSPAAVAATLATMTRVAGNASNSRDDRSLANTDRTAVALSGVPNFSPAIPFSNSREVVSTPLVKHLPQIAAPRSRSDVRPSSNIVPPAAGLPLLGGASLSTPSESTPALVAKSSTAPPQGSPALLNPDDHSLESGMPTSLGSTEISVHQPLVSFRLPRVNPEPKAAKVLIDSRSELDAVTATLHFFADQAEMPDLECKISLVGLTTTQRENVQSVLRTSASQLEVRHMCTPESVATVCDATAMPSHGSGDVLSTRTSASAIDILVDHLKLHCAAALYCHPRFNILFFPIKQNVWKFLQPHGNPHPEAKLHFQILGPPGRTPATDVASTVSRPTFTPVVSREVFGMNMDRMFTWVNGEHLNKALFLMLPLQHQYEMRLIRACFTGTGMKVYQSSDPGSWSSFCSDNKGGGLVLFHPDFYAFGQIPALAAKLLKVGRFNFFQIQITETQGPTGQLPANPGPTFHLARLFPHGRAIFIMDSIFSSNPADTLEVVKSIVDRIEIQRASTKLLGRPGLLQWLHDLAMTEREHQRDSLFYSEDDTRIDTYITLAKILQSDPSYVECPPAPPRPTKSSPIYYLLESDMPEYAGIARKNTREADNIMAAWFASWAQSHVGEFRRFFIIHSGDMMKLWSERYKHIEVMTPHQYLVENPVNKRRQKSR